MPVQAAIGQAYSGLEQFNVHSSGELAFMSTTTSRRWSCNLWAEARSALSCDQALHDGPQRWPFGAFAVSLLPGAGGHQHLGGRNVGAVLEIKLGIWSAAVSSLPPCASPPSRKWPCNMWA